MKKIFLFFVLNAYLVHSLFATFIIRETFPNTVDDKNLEYIGIEYIGEGVSSLSGFTLEDATKTYNFGDDIFQKNEMKKYYRSETSIILNNTGKEIYLKDNEGNIVDTFIYGNTTKGIIYRKDEDGNLVEIVSEEETSPQPETTSPQPSPGGEGEEGGNNSNEEEIDEENPHLNPLPEGEGVEGGNINNEIGEEGIIEENLVEEILEENETIIETEIVNISVKNNFQSPTYLNEKDFDFGNNQAVYNCDRTRDDCRVNLDFRPTFVGDLKENQFNCFVDFGFGNITGEENKCNPNTVVVPLGSYTFDIKITHKTNENISGNLKMRVINDGKLIIPKTETQIVYQNVSSSNSSTQTTNNSSSTNTILDFPQPIIKIQSGLEKNNTCNKKECSVNLIYEMPNKNLDCSWDFGEGIFRVGDDSKCNPIAVKYNSGKHVIKLEVCEKGNDTNCKNEVLEFENLYKKQEVKSVITLQGRLTKNKTLDGDNKIICSDVESCSINFTGGNSSGEKITFFWDFGNGEYFDGRNPASKIFEVGYYEVRLEVTDLDGDFDESFFIIEVIGKIDKALEKDNLLNDELFLSSNLDELIDEKKSPIKLQIDLQGRLGNNKILDGNTLICIKTCSVNFDGSNSGPNLVSYFWDFGNGEYFEGKNPPYISYKNYGKYIVLFSVEDKFGEIKEEEFFINFVEKLEDVKQENNNNLDQNLSLSSQVNFEEMDEDFLFFDDDENELEEENYLLYFFILFIILFFGASFFILKKYDFFK